MNHENGFHRVSFKELSLQDGSLKELEEHLANQHFTKRAETNSFSQESFPKDQLRDKRAKTNGFSPDSFSRRILSLQMCLLIFLIGSFYLAGAALYLTTCSFKISLPTQSLQQEELAAAYCNKSFQQESLQQDELQTAYLNQLDRDTSLSYHCFNLPRCSKITLQSFNQLDPIQSLIFQMLGSTSVSYQLQADSFRRISFELRAYICATLLQTIRFRNSQLQSFQLTGFQLSNALASGGAQQTASQHQLDQLACSTRTFSIALTLTALSTRMSAWILHSLSLALGAFTASSSKIAWRNLAFNKSLLTKPLSTTTSSQRTSFNGSFANNKTFANNIFPQISFQDSFCSNIFQKISFNISFDKKIFEHNK